MTTNSLTIEGNYVGTGGRLNVRTALGADSAPSDRLVISGGAASGTTGIGVTNVGGSGALTPAMAFSSFRPLTVQPLRRTHSR